MNKLLQVAFVLMMAIPSVSVWAQSPQTNEKPQWVQDLEKNHAPGRHDKKIKPVRKISGTAIRGAKQVSPLVVKKNK
jgi:hypothetical protein